MDTRTGQIVNYDDVKESLRSQPGESKYFVPIRRDLTVKEKADMQIRLYAPCGCGSGKKFKFCCRTKARSASGQNVQGEAQPPAKKAMNTPKDSTGGCCPPPPCSPWNRGDKPPPLPLTVIGVVSNKPVLVWYHTRTRCWHDNPAAFGSVPVEWWQYLPDCELLKANVQAVPPSVGTSD